MVDKKTSKNKKAKELISGNAPWMNMSLKDTSWINFLNIIKTPIGNISAEHQELFLKGLKENPTWVSEQKKNGTTALILMACWGEVELVQALIHAGSNINHQKETGETALMLGSSWNQWEVVKSLIEAGADLNLQNKEGCTALMYASESGSTEAVHELIKSGARLNEQDKKGYTALMKAIEANYIDIVEVLIEAGAEMRLKNKNNQTAWDIAKSLNVYDSMIFLEAERSEKALSLIVNPMGTPEEEEAGADESKTKPSSKKNKIIKRL